MIATSYSVHLQWIGPIKERKFGVIYKIEILHMILIIRKVSQPLALQNLSPHSILEVHMAISRLFMYTF